MAASSDRLLLPASQRLRQRRDALKRLVAPAGGFFLAGCGTPAFAQVATKPAGAPAANVPAPEPIRDKGYQLVQNWDFASTVTNDQQLRAAFHTRYIYDNGKLDKLNDEWQRFRDNNNHVFRDGMLVLVARPSAGAESSLASGKIDSGMLRSKWAGQYGYFECRMKVPPGRGLWPAFWLNPEDKTWPPEIDIVEIVNNGRDTTRNSFHYVHGGEPPSGKVVTSLLNPNKTYKPGFDYADDFHTFAVEWTADRTRHFVDDVLVVEREFRWVHKNGSDAGPAHVLLNLAVGGGWPGAPGADALPAELRVRYIRVWQQQPR